MKKSITAVIIVLMLAACADDAPAVTGTLRVSIDIQGTDSSTLYALFTEAAYLSGQYLPLRQGGTGNQQVLDFAELLPGTYVFVLYTSNVLTFTGQVVTGKQSELSVTSP